MKKEKVTEYSNISHISTIITLCFQIELTRNMIGQYKLQVMNTLGTTLLPSSPPTPPCFVFFHTSVYGLCCFSVFNKTKTLNIKLYVVIFGILSYLQDFGLLF